MPRNPTTVSRPFARKVDASGLDRTPARDKIAADILAFEEAGGIVEKLGTTYTLTRLVEVPQPSPAVASEDRSKKQTLPATGARHGS